MSSKSKKAATASIANLLQVKQWSKCRFNPLDIPAIAIVVVCGATGAGKTVLLTEVMKVRNPNQYIIACCSPECYKSYAKNFVFTRCFDKIDDKFIKKYKTLLTHYGRVNGMCEQQVNDFINKVEPAGRAQHEQEGKSLIQELHVRAKAETWSDTRLETEERSFRKKWVKVGEERASLRTGSYNKLLAEKRAPHIWTAIFDDLSNQTIAKDKTAWHLPIFGEDAKAGRQSVRSVWFLGQSLLDMKCSNRGQTTTLILYPIMSDKEVSDLFKHWIPACGLKRKEFEAILNFFKNQGWWMVINKRLGFGQKKGDVGSERGSDSDDEAKNVQFGLDPREFISWYSPVQNMYVERYIGSPKCVYHHLLWFDIQRTERYMFRNAPKLLKNAARSKALAEIGGGKINKEAKKEAEKSLKQENYEKEAQQMAELVRNIGPADMVRLLKQIDEMEPQLYQRYTSSGFVPSAVSAPSPTKTKKSNEKKKKKKKHSTESPPSPMIKSNK